MEGKSQLAGMRAVYLTAAELSNMNFIVCTTSRNAQGADLLITDQQCSRAFSVQVKSNTYQNWEYFLIGEKGKDIISETHIYVLVNIKKPSKKNPIEIIEYYVVPSKVVAEKIVYEKSKTGKAEWWYVLRKDILPYRDRWDIFGENLSQQDGYKNKTST